MTIGELTQTHGWKNFMSKLYGFGAAVVIIGALFKIMHWPGASMMLIIGLSVEALIFFFSAFEPLHEELDWTLAYPELAGLDEGDEIMLDDKKSTKKAANTSGGDALMKFDQMLEKAGDSNIFEKFGQGITDLNKKVGDLANISDAAIATNDFTKNVKNASTSVNGLSKAYSDSAASFNKESGQLTGAYKQASESLSFSVENLSDTYNKTAQKIDENNKTFVEAYKKMTSNMNVDFSSLKQGHTEYSTELSNLNKNISALNAIFEIQLNEADLDKMMADLQGSVVHSKKYSEEVTKLGKRLEALNTVYGNMLSAMNVKID